MFLVRTIPQNVCALVQRESGEWTSTIYRHLTKVQNRDLLGLGPSSFVVFANGAKSGL